MIGGELEGVFLVDAHVHYYSRFSLGAFLGHALSNFQKAAGRLRLSFRAGCLLLTETHSEDLFSELKTNSSELRDAGWEWQHTEESGSLIVYRSEGGPPIIIVKGYQIRTAEGLEVLSVCSDARVPDGLDFLQTIGRVRGSGAVAIVPWGFGKWMFRRGSFLRRVIAEQEILDFHLGDNSGRLRWFRPELFRAGASRGMFVLPGTDPLPLGRQVQKVGGFGSILRGSIPAALPASGIGQIIEHLEAQPETYGAAERPFAFIRNQAAMQLRKHWIFDR